MQLVETGERPCRVCDRPHNRYCDPANHTDSGSWADLNDGHTYEPVSWEEMYRREVAKR